MGENTQRAEPIDPPSGDHAALSLAAGESGADGLDLGDERAPETPGKALVHVAIGAVLFGAITAGYLWNANRSHGAQVLVVEARPLIELADVASLKKAAELLEESLAIKATDRGLAALAEVHTLQWVLHGIAESEAEAKRLVEEARAANVERAERYSAEALIAYHEGRHDDSIAVAQEVLSKGGVSERLNWTLGLALRAKGEPAVGRDNLRKAQDSKSGAPHYAVSLGDAYEEDGDRANAALFWGQAYQANSNYVPAAARNLIARARKGEDLGALETELARVADADPELLGPVDRAAIELARAELLYLRGRTRESVAAAEKAIADAGPNAMRLYALGRARLGDGKEKQGLEALTQAAAAAPGAKKYYFASILAHAEHGAVKDALALLERSPEKEKLADDPRYLTLRGDVLRQKGDFKKAEESYQQALERNESFADALLGMGLSKWRQKELDDATSWFEKAVGVRSNFPEVYEAIGLMWIEQGASSQANPQLEMAEKQYRARGVGMLALRDFYGKVIKTYSAHRGNTSYVSAWVAREKALR